MSDVTSDPILRRFRDAFRDVYGKKLDRAVLFGSRARGNSHELSDYDVAVFLNDSESFGREAERLAIIETDILYETGAVINSLPFPSGSERDATAFMTEVHRDGRIL
jgi:predicted nucleotidyltransferase